MLKQQAAKAFDNFKIVTPPAEQAFNDRITVEKLPPEMKVAPVLQMAMAIMEAAKTKFKIKDNDIWVHGLHPDAKDGWSMEIRTHNHIPHYKFQSTVADIVREKIMAFETAQNDAPSVETPTVPLALGL